MNLKNLIPLFILICLITPSLYATTYPGVDLDPDINSFTTKDMKDISKAGVGTGSREFVSWISPIVAVIMTIFIFGSFFYIWFKLRKKEQQRNK